VPLLNFRRVASIEWFRCPAANRPAFTFYGEKYIGSRDERFHGIGYPDETEKLYDHRPDAVEFDSISHQTAFKKI
jgi:hypothetical protein